MDNDEKSARITVKVLPRSSRSEIGGENEGAIKVWLTSPPVNGAANSELIALMAKRLGVPKSTIEITSGLNSRTKHIRIEGVSEERVRELLGT